MSRALPLSVPLRATDAHVRGQAVLTVTQGCVGGARATWSLTATGLTLRVRGSGGAPDRVVAVDLTELARAMGGAVARLGAEP